MNSRQRAKRQKAAADSSGLEWDCVTILNEEDDAILNEEDDVNLVVRCKFCSWQSEAALAQRESATTSYALAPVVQPSAAVAALSTAQ